MKALLIMASLASIVFLLQTAGLEGENHENNVARNMEVSRPSIQHELTRWEMWDRFNCDAYFASPHRPTNHDDIWKTMHRTFYQTAENTDNKSNIEKAIVIPYSVQYAGNKGLGLFADEFIPKGTLVTDYRQHGRFLFPNGQDFRQFVYSNRRRESCISLQCSGIEVYDSGAKISTYLDDACFMNHSNEPNVGAGGDAADCGEYDCEYALRDIHAGEEILCAAMSIIMLLDGTSLHCEMAASAP